MFERADLEDFVARLEFFLVTAGGGKVEVDMNRLRELVRGHEDLAIGAAKSYTAIAPHGRGWAQLALLLGAAYQLEFDDDSLYRSIQDDLKRVGMGDVHLELKAPAPALNPPKIVMMKVDADGLAAQDIYSVTRLLSVDREEVGALIPSMLRGRVVITFPLDNDPRPVWRVPEAQGFLTKLFEAMPYLPYYLHPDPRMGMGFMLVASLASDDAFSPDGQLDLTHPTVVGPLLRSLAAVVAKADSLQDSPEVARGQVLSLLPEHYVQWLLNHHAVRD